MAAYVANDEVRPVALAVTDEVLANQTHCFLTAHTVSCVFLLRFFQVLYKIHKNDELHTKRKDKVEDEWMDE